jgi:hypothetical protein
MDTEESNVVVSDNGEVQKLPVSMQLYQAIYNDITGKTESIKDSYDKNIILSMSDLTLLRSLLQQFCEQYHIDAYNVAITFFHNKSSKEQFSSFDRLSTYNVTTTAPIERINIQLNILITPPKISKPQNYTITIDIISGEAIIDKAEHAFPISLIMKAVQDKSVQVKIEYIDYIIARSFSDLIKSWVETIEERSPDESIILLQSRSHYYRRMISASFLIISITICVYLANIFLKHDDVKLYNLAQFLLIAVPYILVLHDAGEKIGKIFERRIDSMNNNEFSLIKINSGDERLYKKFSHSSKNTKIMVWKSRLITLGFGVVSSIIGSIIYTYSNSYLS